MSQEVGSQAIKFECGICQKEFSTSWCLQIHIQTHNEKKTVVCQECGESFPDVTLLYEHLKVHILGENVETCQVCGKEYPSSEIEAHKRSHIFKPGLTCNICGKSFGSRQVLVLHLRSHGAKDPFKCQMCGLQFASRNSFSQHWNSHLSQKGSEKKGVMGKKKGKHNDFGIFTKDGKRLKCILCNKIITSKAKAYQHAKSHAIKKRSIFDTRKPCQSEDNLESKKQSGRRTRQTQNLKQAVPLKKKTPVSDVVSRLLSCSECDEHFRDIDELQKHKIIHIEELSARLLRLSSPPGKICKPLKPKLVLDAVQSIVGKNSQGPEKQRNLHSESILDPDDTDDESLVLEQPEDMCQESFVSLSDIFASPEHRDHEGSKTNIPNLYKLQNVKVVLERLDESKIKQLSTRLSSQRLDDKEHKCADSDNEDDVSLLSTVEDESTPNITSFDTEPVSMDVEFDDEDDVIEDIGDISNAVNAAMAACADVHKKTSVAVPEGGPRAQSTYIWSVKEPQLDPVDDVEEDEVASEDRLKGRNNKLSHLSETEVNESKSGIQSSINGSTDTELKPREETNETQSSTIKMNYRKVEDKYVCSICEKSFEYSQTIYRHVYEHLKKSKGLHICSFCGLPCERKTHLEAHESLHIKLHATIGGVRKEDVQKIKEHTLKNRSGFSCKVCSLTFKLRIEVYRHVFSHFFSGTNNTDKSGIGDLCETEPRENGTKILLHEALKYFVAKDGSYTCSKCERVLQSKKTAYVHYKRHVMSAPFSCSVCTYAAYTRHHLDRHLKTHKFKRNLKFICNSEVMKETVISNAPNAATAAGDDDLEKTSSQDSAAASEGGPGNQSTSVCSTEESHFDPVDDVEEDAVASDFSLQDDPGYSDDCVEGNEDIEIGTAKHSDESCIFKYKICDFSSGNRLEAKNHKLSHLTGAEENESKSGSGDKDESGIQSLINDSSDTELKPREETNETQSSTIKMNYRKVEDKYVCSICEKSFENSQTIYRHVYEHLKKSKGLHICSFCGQSRDRRTHLEAHESLHIKLHATIGGVRKEDVQKIKEHTLKDGTGFSCKLCSLTFKLSIEVYRHVFSHFFSGTNNTDKSGIGDLYETEPRENEKKILLHEALKYFVAKDGSYTCLKCEKVLQSKKTAYVHYKRHVMSAPFSCSVCPYAAFTRHHLDQHLKTHLCKRNLKFICNSEVMKETVISNAPNAATAAGDDDLEKTSSQDSAAASEGDPGNQSTSVCSTEESHFDPVDDVEEDAVASDFSLQDDPGYSDDCVEGNENIEIGTAKHSDESCIFKCKICDFSSGNRLEAKNHKLSHLTGAEENESKSGSGDKDESGIQSLINDSSDTELKPREETNETQSSTIKMNYRKVEDKYVCSICEKSFEYSQTIYRHVYEHLKKSKGLHICSFCGLPCERRTHLEAHESLHIKLHASIGGVRKEDVQKIKEHTLKDGTGFSCKVCSLTFKIRIDAYRHVFSHFFSGTNNTDKSCIFDPSETGYTANKKKILLQESLKYFLVKDGVYTCSKCETVIHSKKAAYVHYKRHVMFPPFSCSVCPYAAYTRHHLDKHMKTHSYRRKEDAGNVKQFTIKEALAYIQVEEKGFRCKVCNNILKTRDIAIAHVVRHNQKGRFRCEVCGHRTHTRHHLKRHAKRHIQKRQISNTKEEVVPDSGDQLCNPSNIDSHEKGVEQESRLKMSNPKSSLLSTSGSHEIMPHLENINNPENSNPECSGEKCSPLFADLIKSTAPENQTTFAIKTASQSQYSNNEFCPDQDTQNDLESSFSKAVKSTLSDDYTGVKRSPTSTQSLALTEGERKNVSTGFETTGNRDAMDIDDSGNIFPTRRRSQRMSSMPNISYKDSADTIDEEDDSDLDSDFQCEDSDHSSMAVETEDEKCSGNEKSNQPACLPSSRCVSEDGSRQEPATETEEQNKECERGITKDSTHTGGYITKKDNHFECNICMKTFANKKRCHAHISYHHLDQLSCPKCSFQTTSKAYMMKHLQKHNCTFKETFCCKICKDSFKTFYDLSSHIDSHTTEEKMEVLKYLECGTCGEICKTSMMLFSHQLGHLEKFQCEECKSEFKSAQELENHLIEEGHYKCDQCDNVFTSFVSLDDHLKIIHKSSFYKKQNSIKKKKLSFCGLCYETFQTKKDLYLHKMQKHISEEEGFNCDICYENFTKLHLLARHKLVHASLAAIGIDSTTGISGSVKLTKMVPCTICSKTYPTITKLREHLKIHEEKQFVCDVCGLAFLRHNYLLIHEKLHKNIKPYHCKLCPRKYAALTLLKSHIKNCHSGKKERKYAKCDVCSKLLCKSSLQKHMKTHLKRSKNFPCSQCGKMFYSKSQLKSHEKTHEERSFVCDECGLSLKSKYVLKYHKQSHTDEKPFVCEECGTAFRMKATLEKHMLTHTKVKDHVCEFCNKRFALPGTLKNHRNIHTGEKPYKCKVCKMCFSDRWAKFKHEKSHAEKDS